MSQKTILLIDDDSGFRLMMQKALESAGHRVITGEEGQSAIRAAWSDKPDLIISDLDMPVQDGYKTINMFQNDPSVTAPIIVVSGTVDEHHSQKVLDAGASAFFRKPVNLFALLGKVSELLAEG